MSTSERKLADTTGEIMLAAREQRSLPDAEWAQGRILLSNKRLVLATSAETRTVPLGDIQEVGGRVDASIEARQVADYVAIRITDRTYLVAASDQERFERALFRALLHGKQLLIKHPAVAGGVVTDEEWQPATLTVDEEELAVAMQSGEFVGLALEEMSGLEAAVRTVEDDQRLVLAMSHLDPDGTIVETHLAVEEGFADHLHTYLRRGLQLTETNVDLSETERAVLMALYSGLSPFDIPEFLDRDVDRIETIYARLIDLDLVEEVRVRREVELNVRGRNVANVVSENQ